MAAERERVLAAIQTAQGCAAAVRSRPDVAPYIRRVNGPGGTAATAEQMADPALPTPEEARAAGVFARAVRPCGVELARSLGLVSMRMGQIASNMNEDRRSLIQARERREIGWGHGLHKLAAQHASGRDERCARMRSRERKPGLHGSPERWMPGCGLGPLPSGAPGVARAGSPRTRPPRPAAGWPCAGGRRPWRLA